MEKKKKLIAVIAIVFMIVLFGTMSYAFFTTIVDNTNRTEAQLTTGTMALTFKDNDSTINEKLMFGESVTKKFTIENTGTLETSLSLDWYDLVNTYTLGSLTYKLEYSDIEDGEYQTIVDTTNVPVTSETFTLPVTSEISVPAGATYYYNLIITLENLPDVDQSDDVDAIFHTKFTVDQPSKYRYYTLVVDPGDGTWDSMTGVQSYQLMNNETIDMPEPTREGYTFQGWSITSVAGNLSNDTYSMGISNAKLVAKWEVNKYTLTIDANGGTYSGDASVELEYNTSTEIGTPTREGYTFTGWNVSSGNLSGNTYTIGVDNATLTATWQINNYKYIVYHYQQSIDGSEYTLVSADTDEGEATYNTTFTPDRKTYTGFTSPSGKTLTIKAETVYPPVLNKVDYKYARNKYTLTVDVGDGTYTGDAIPSDGIYYQSSVNLGEPTKTGYSFSNWSATNGTVTDNTYTMSNTSNDTVKANYTPNEYAITFNANGGTVDTQSKTVTYDSTYGTLPSAILDGYQFQGWYTSDGESITKHKTVKIANDTVLVARWTKAYSSEQVLAHLGLTSKTETPDLSTIASTDETADGLYSTEDDYGTSYYFRGAVENNYVKFGKYTKDIYYGYDSTGSIFNPSFSATCYDNDYRLQYNCTLKISKGTDMYWRIIRINGDGSIRLIYDGTYAHENGDADYNDRVITTQTTYNDYYADVKYVGYMFGGTSYTAASTSYEEATNNKYSSHAKNFLDRWYEQLFLNSEYELSISDEIFCNDRTIYQGLGYGQNITNFGIDKTNTDYSLKCNQKNDRFSKSDTLEGNGDLTYPIGTLTYEEGIYAGSIHSWYTSNENNYLTKGRPYRTMTPSHAGNNSTYGFSTYMFEFETNGEVVEEHTSTGGGSIVPVINLTSESAMSLIGSGTMSDPYRIS